MGFVKLIDKISLWTGAISAWLVVPLLLVVINEVVRRHFLNMPTEWGYDTSWMLFSAQFMLGGAYTLLKDGHIRIDIVYNTFSPRNRKIFDSLIYLVVFLPVSAVFLWAGINFCAEAWAAGERLSTTNWMFPSGPPKTLIPVGFFLLGLQAVAEAIKAISTLAQGGKS